ncbi:MAG: hypothetical protein JWN03_3284 [Nocardia sp.]|uniref:helix-turn-helix domain-containing protein n=1 Tax=Nocardia sp. TaxID=1821 RepID=UPI00260DECD2|nr:helix-turn-helix domain-containing protein [Nocardia sp.]MCU1643009.1 hypothetical protein [Nocardia sp.]
MPEDGPREWLTQFATQPERHTDIDRLAGLIGDQVFADLPNLPGDLEMRHAAEVNLRTQLREFMAALGRSSFDVRVPAEAIDLARTLARRNLDIGIPMQGFRIGQRVLWQYVIHTVDESITEESLRREALVLLWERATEWIDTVLEATIAAYTLEREQLQRGVDSRRTSAVHAVLRGEPVEIDELSRTLGHAVRRYQTALALTTDTDTDTDTDAAASDLLPVLMRQATETAAALGGTRPLMIASGARGLWAWVATPEPPTDGPLPLPRRGIRIAMGTSSPGVTGFVHSHREALAAQRVAAGGVALVRYADVELVCLTTGDGSMDAMRALITRELGALANRRDSNTRLRDTVRVFLINGCNAASAGKELGIHENTVRYRVRQAEQLLGHVLEERRVHIELALRSLHAMGDRILPDEQAL